MIFGYITPNDLVTLIYSPYYVQYLVEKVMMRTSETTKSINLH